MTRRSQLYRDRVHAKTNWLGADRKGNGGTGLRGVRYPVDANRSALEAWFASRGYDPKGYLKK